MSIPIGGPIVLLRCRKCGKRTDHAMIDSEANKKGEIEEIYECQECGEVKRIYEFAALYVHGLRPPSVINLKGPQKKRRLF